ncbi:hypothetical protein ACFLZK_00260 [Patescibacteria group bacterium]
MKKIFVPILLTLLLFKSTYSQQYFDFNLNKKYIYQNNEIEISFLYNFEGYSEGDFIVRPQSSSGIIEIYDTEKNVWIKNNDLWSNMPILEKNMRVRTNLVGKSILSFEIQSTLDAKIYKTGEKTIWGGDLFGNYVEKLNRNMLTYKLKEIKKESPTTRAQQQDKPQNLLAKMIKYIDEII